MTQIPNYGMQDKISHLLREWGMSAKWAIYCGDFSALVLILVITILIYYISKYIINRILKRLIVRSRSLWDDYLYEERVFTRLALLLPAFILDISLKPVISDYPQAIHYIDLGLKLYMAFVVLLVFISFLNALYHIYNEIESTGRRPIKSYVQIAKIVAYVIWSITIISWLAGQSPLTILAGLGAISAVLLLIFKDSILGFVAGVQLSSNKMVQIGDWITFPKHNADGTVFDISLITVKVRNFDNSVSLIPTYALISESFQNWRSMPDAGGRRIKRSIFIDIFSVRIPDEEMIRTISEYYKPGEQKDLLLNEHLTNLGMFRNYLMDYLRNHPRVNTRDSIMVRQLQPTENGIPVELYLFYKPPVKWEEFEEFQSQLLEHTYAVMPFFGLKAYQRPSYNITGLALPENAGVR